MSIRNRSLFAVAAGAAACGALCDAPAQANPPSPPAGDLVVSRSAYSADSSILKIGDPLPGGGNAVADGSYPGVWANETPDPSFGVTSPIFLDRYAVSGTTLTPVHTVAVPTNQLVTSFSSKSEMALNLSTDGKWVTFMGYVAPTNTLDVSNSNTTNHVDPTNPVKGIFPRAVAQFDAGGASDSVQVTPVNTYSGNNGRAAILDSVHNQYYLAGNAGNGTGTQPVQIVNNTGVQIATPGGPAETTVVGVQQGVPGAANGFQFGFSVIQSPYNLPPFSYTADKSGKDDNYRSVKIFNNTLYVAKGSGGNGINTVYQVGTAGTLPTTLDAATTTFTILPGFPTGLAKNAGATNPFAIFFADANTLYVADEGDGKAADAATGAGGLQKWSLQGDGNWHLLYTLTKGLNLGVPYAVAGLPVILNPAADGLRNLTGRINGDGTVTLFAVTSTVSASTDQGADCNQLVAITDSLGFQSSADASGESFAVLQTATYGQVLRGVSFVPLNPPVANAGIDQTVECAGALTQTTLVGTGSTGPAGHSLAYSWTENGKQIAAGASPVVKFGMGLNVVTLTVTDTATGLTSTDSVNVNVVDTTQPTLSVSGVPAQLWPANHKMVRFFPVVTTSDACDASPTVTLKVKSSEPDDGTGDGDTAGDIVVHSPTDVELRAERSGNGPGRTYTLTWTSTDDSGNARSVTLVVTVPHSK
jgi:hypothetical protein